MKVKVALLGLAGIMLAACNKPATPTLTEWVSTTYENPWQTLSLEGVTSDTTANTIEIDPTLTVHTIDVFGTCFNELGWASLKVLSDEQLSEIFSEMFEPGKGANFLRGRMSIGANDFALDYYSCDDTDGDFELKDFSIERDKQNIIPMIKWAQKYQPNLLMWASPWCPPKWMKLHGKHYAERAVTPEIIAQREKRMKEMMAKREAEAKKQAEAQGIKPGEQGGVSATSGFFTQGALAFRMEPRVNDAVPGEEGFENVTSFNMDPKYLDAYARYFGKFVDAYKAEGIPVTRVMPQNEPNSAQPYPSCSWTSKDLNTFVGKYLGPEMEKHGVEVYFGTVERADYLKVDTLLQDPDSKKYIKGLGFQWAGKDALPKIHELYPNLTMVQSEQECGNGLNNWEGAMHSWDLMKHYLGNGVSEYYYWNTSLFEGKASTWGWHQNSLITVKEEDKTYKWTPEYYTIKHASHYVLPGAKYLNIAGSYSDAMAFVNSDGSVVVLAANQTEEAQPVTIKLAGKAQTVVLPAKSLNTFVLK
jgi:glucosylceramidase